MTEQMPLGLSERVWYCRSDEELRRAYSRDLPHAQVPVVVIANGSGTVEDLATLFEALKSHTLSPAFRRAGNFREDRWTAVGSASVEFFGGFWDVSHVFRVICLARCETERRLTEAVRTNVNTPAYAAACVEDDAAVRARAEREAAERRGRVA